MALRPLYFPWPGRYIPGPNHIPRIYTVMKYDISKFEELVNEGFLRKSEKGDLVLYGYTDKCTFARNWNEYTRVARGLILNKNTGEVVAKPFPKFFNLGEMEETFLINLPMTLPYKSFEKVDGSLGIIFNYDGEWQISTRGSFYSDQAVKGAELLKKYDFTAVPVGMTILAEIIYPENKIIVNYGKEEKLVMLGAYSSFSGEEIHPDVAKFVAANMGIEYANSFDHTILDMIALQKTMPKDEEGFVVRFENGLRVKIKGDEYMRIAKMIAHMSPISFWESMQEGIVNRQYLAQLPEEFKQEYEPIVAELEKQFQKILQEIEIDVVGLPTHGTSPEDRKKIGLFLKDTKDIKHPSAMFSYVLKQKDSVTKYIMKQIRPDGNDLRSLE